MALEAWFRVTWNSEEVRLAVEPPGRSPWAASFPWSSVSRVCFKAEGLEASDGIHVFTRLRAESFAIPMEASGGAELWNEIVRRGLFDRELAIKAASAREGVFCWPFDDAAANEMPPLPDDQATCRHCGGALGRRDLVCPGCRRLVLHTGTTVGAFVGVLLCVFVMVYLVWREFAE